MFERFTDRARRVLVLAQEEARVLRHDAIGSEHILLALVHEGEGVAAKALAALGVSIDELRDKVAEAIGPAEGEPAASPPFTPGAKSVLELSLREALQLGHNYIGTEHMLLGVVREGGVAAGLLAGVGADASLVREHVLRLLAGGVRRDPTPAAGERPAVRTEPIVDAGPGVTPGPVPVDPTALVTWDDVEQLAAEAAGIERATVVPRVGGGIEYRSCLYEPRVTPSVTVSVVAAEVTGQAFERTTAEWVEPTARPVDGIGDAATFNRLTGTLRVLAGNVAFSIAVPGHPHPLAAATALARRALNRLPPHENDPSADPGGPGEQVPPSPT